METKLNLKQWVEAFKEGKFEATDVVTQCTKAGWYDWFCKDKSLAGKTKKLGTCLKQIVDSPKLNPEEQYVFFKNNCPGVGKLYDDFRICDIKSGKVVYTIIPKSGHTTYKGFGEVWGSENSFANPLFSGSWKEIKKWFFIYSHYMET